MYTDTNVYIQFVYEATPLCTHMLYKTVKKKTSSWVMTIKVIMYTNVLSQTIAHLQHVYEGTPTLRRNSEY